MTDLGQTSPARMNGPPRTGWKVRQTSPPLEYKYSRSSSGGSGQGHARSDKLRGAPSSGPGKARHRGRTAGCGGGAARTLALDDARSHDQEASQGVAGTQYEREGHSGAPAAAPAGDPATTALGGAGAGGTTRPARASSPPVAVLGDSNDEQRCGSPGHHVTPDGSSGGVACGAAAGGAAQLAAAGRECERQQLAQGPPRQSGAQARSQPLQQQPQQQPPQQPPQQQQQQQQQPPQQPPQQQQQQQQQQQPLQQLQQQQPLQQHQPQWVPQQGLHWHPGRPGYAELSRAVEARRSLLPPGATYSLPTSWGVGLLCVSRVVLNSKLSPALEQVFDALQQALTEQEQGQGQATEAEVLGGEPLVAITKGLDVPDDDDHHCGTAAAGNSRNTHKGRGRRGKGGRGKGGKQHKATAPLADKAAEAFAQLLRGAVAAQLGLGPGAQPTDLQVMRHLPELLAPSHKVREVRIGGRGVPPSPWDALPGMAGAGSSLVAVEALAAGEVLGVYSGEAGLKAEYSALCRSPPLEGGWDDPHPDRPCPYSCMHDFAHEMGRYTVDVGLPAAAVELLHEQRGDQLSPELARELRPGAAKSYPLATTARRLGCALAAINDPRRNLAATWEEDADFPDGHPNAEFVDAVLCGLWPLVLVVAARDIPASTHVSASYGCDYWALHREEQHALLQVRRERQRAQAAEAAASQARLQAAQWQQQAAAAEQRLQQEAVRSEEQVGALKKQLEQERAERRRLMREVEEVRKREEAGAAARRRQQQQQQHVGTAASAGGLNRLTAALVDLSLDDDDD